MKHTLGRLFKLASGWVLVALGIAGCFLPLLPGTPFLLFGLALLSAQSEWLRSRIAGLRRGFSGYAARLYGLGGFLVSKFRRREPS